MIGYLDRVAGSSALGWLGRFCHAEPRLLQELRTIARVEQERAGDTILAEVCHLPEHVAANILIRPILREFEIPCGSRSGAREENQIRLDDLLVSVVDRNIVLWSMRLQKRIKPTLATAHAYRRSPLKVYQFLAALASRDSFAFRFTWPALFERLRHLPRVTFERFVLSPALWRIDLTDAPSPRHERREWLYQQLRELAAQESLPESFNVLHGDSVDEWLFCANWKKGVGMELLLDACSKVRALTLQESFLQCSGLLSDGTKYHSHEIVLPLLVERRNAQPAKLNPIMRNVQRTPKMRRRFSAGTQWVTRYIYCGQSTADEILTGPVQNLVSYLHRSNLMESWYFLRYNLPEWHLRLRVKARSPRHADSVNATIDSYLSSVVEDDRVRRIETTDYEREIERYGGDNGIELFEHIFYADSECVLRVLKHVGYDETARWKVALYGAHRILLDLIEEHTPRYLLMKQRTENWLRSLSDATNIRQFLGATFRQHRQELEGLLLRRDSENQSILRCMEDYRERTACCTDVIKAIHSVATTLTRPLVAIAGDIIHMHVNRVLPDGQNEHEGVFNEFLLRIYETEKHLSVASKVPT
jgi:thiopeptide-type bacteriocin biosynthesis protein